MIRRIAHVALFLAGLFGSSAAIRHADPMPFFSWTRQKAVHLQSKVDDVDTIFVGSSRFNYGIRPELFDARMAELGAPTRSFNASLSGLRQADHDEIVEWILRHRSPALKRVVIELHSWRQSIRGGYWFTDQEIELHTPRSFLPRMQAVWTDGQGLADKVAETGFVLAHTLCNTLCIGQGVRILRERVRTAAGEPLPGVHPVEGRGWMDCEQNASAPMVKEHDDFVRDRARFDRQLGSKIDDIAPQWLVGPANLGPLLAQDARLRAAGIEPVYVVMPSWHADQFGRSHVAAYRRHVRVLELDLVADNPALFARELWYDASHFNRAGAEAFTPWLAERMAAELAQPVGAPAPVAAVAPAPLQLQAAFDAANARFELTVACDALRGRIEAVAAKKPGRQDFGGGVVLGVSWPPDWRVPMERQALSGARVTIPAAAFAADEPVFLQAMLVDGDRAVAVSGVVEIPAGR